LAQAEIGVVKARGFIAWHRSAFQHPLLDDRPFNRGWAFAWLVHKAAWRNGLYRGLQRGQLRTSRSALVEAFGWSDSRVRRFLATCERHGMIRLAPDQETGQGGGQAPRWCGTVITICNYEKHQDLAVLAGQQQTDYPTKGPTEDAQQTLPLPELSAPKPTNQSTTVVKYGDKLVEEGQARKSRTKPPHGARSEDAHWIWFDLGSNEWTCHAKDYFDVRGAEILPENRIGGHGNWFVYLGEAKRPVRRIRRRLG
jgi:hypothetical protein